jgi:hypothetical protein
MKSFSFASAAILCALAAAPAYASHNRGSVLIPTVSANGTLTIEATSFWRPTFVDQISGVSITGPGGTNSSFSLGLDTTDTSDSRYTRVDNSGSFALTGGAGLYTISWSSCCRVSGIANASESTMGTTSTIFWDGRTATNPITFDIENIQPNVVRGSAYSDNLDVTSANGNALSYDDSVLTVSINSQAPGFAISPTGQITIPGAATAAYPENPSNIGADVAFSGEIIATRAGGGVAATVQFDWLFDAVAAGANQVPDVADVVINAFVGDTIMTSITGTDPNGDPVTLSLLGFNGPGGAVMNGVFTPGAPGNPASGNFMWNSTGFGVGTYIASILGTDGSLSDQGTITINLTNRDTTVVPLPASLMLLGSAVAGMGVLRRRRRA